jgi:putative DNA primase/helicase
VHDSTINPQTGPRDATLLDAALAYAARGWHVFPCHTPTQTGCSCRRKCDRIGKHPRTKNGLSDATTAEATIRRWWQMWPEANVAIRTGAVSGLVVLDNDIYKGGDTSLRELERSYSALPETVLSLTGGGGEQSFFQHPGSPVKNGVDALGVGLDIRGDGGYVIAPPSLHKSSARYVWEVAHEPDDTPLALLPGWVLALCQETAHRAVPSAGEPIPDHQRNDTLFRHGCSFRAKGCTEAVILAALREMNTTQCQPPITDAEVQKIVGQVVKYEAGPSTPDLRQQRNGDAPGPTGPEPLLPLSDYTNALAFVRDHGQDVRYLEAWGKWLHWSGTHWRYDVQGPIMQKAKATIKRLLRQAEHLDGDKLDAWMKHIKTSLSTGKLKALVEGAQDEPPVVIRLDALNTHRWLLPCLNGTLDLRTGLMHEPQREDFLTECLSIPYDPLATCPIFEAFLWAIMGGPARRSDDADDLVGEELRTYTEAYDCATRCGGFLQRVLGQCLTGDVSEQDLYIFYGTGANGKSTLINIILALLGAYAMKGTAELLMTSRNDRHPTERADLFGKRLVATVETQEAGCLNETFIKEATGGDPIRARRMREDFWEFLPSHTMILATNHKPEIRGTDYAIWRRIKLVPFTVTIPDDQQDKTLPEKLLTELPGILAWMVRGCLDWQAHGLCPPQEVLLATEEYKQEQDVFEAFLATECLRTPTARVSAAEIYTAYETWCKENEIEPIKKRAFGIRLGNSGCKPDQGTGGRREWVGIGLPNLATEDARYGQ